MIETSELRSLSPEELTGRVRQWRDELFRTRFKVQGNEARDTSVMKKLRGDIARALTVLNEKTRGVVVQSKPVAKRVETPETETKAAKASAEGAESKPAKKKTAAKKKE